MSKMTKDVKNLMIKTWDELFSLTKEKPLSAYSSPSRNLILWKRFKGLSFSALDAKAKTFASIPYKLTLNGEKIEDEADAIYKLLKNPNPLFTDYDFRYLYAIYKYGLGEVYIYVVRDRLNIPRQMWILPSQFMRPVWTRDPEKKARGELIDYFELSATSLDNPDIKMKFTPDEIIYIRTPSPVDIYRGFGELQALLLESDIHYLAKEYVRDFYKNGAIPMGVLTTDLKLTEEEIRRLRRQWEERHRGSSNGWKVAILFGGLKYEKISSDPTTSSFIEQSKWTRDDILAVHRTPLSKLGYTENVNKAVAREQNIMFSKDVIYPEIVRYAEMINTQLFNTPFLQRYKIKFYNIVPKDEELLVDKARVGATFGAITINELRNFLGLEPLKEGGDELVPALNTGGRPKGSTKPESENQQDGEDVSSEDAEKSIKEWFDSLFLQIDGVVDELLREQ